MACTNCATGCGVNNTKENIGSTGVAGCKSNGACGCNKMNTFDWLKGMEVPVAQRFPFLEVRFRNGRKEFFRNPERLELTTGDAVVVEVPNGYHMGYVSLQGELVRLQMMKYKIKDTESITNVMRIATPKDLEKYLQVQERNLPTLFRTRQIVQELQLNMKLSDVEFQADNTKAIFYYSADERVDFRELIKLLATEFKVRVEMKQISLRQEAARLGGIGSCGRELCCSTWLTDFKSVNTHAARYQNLSLNPSKLSGQCGRLKCCLNYELDTYMDALQGIPQLESPLKTRKGTATLTKTDIFRKIMWFAYHEESNWHPISVERVKAILEMNKNGTMPESLTEDVRVNAQNAISRYTKQNENNSNKKSRERENVVKTNTTNQNQPKKTVKPNPNAQNNAQNQPQGKKHYPQKNPNQHNKQRPHNKNQQGQQNKGNEGGKVEGDKGNG
ncbi:MAG: Signal peptidase-like protein [Bacteroidetes bacterium]|nr:MAG: Signal peptidase-like protein [Bacteroidota bacterium]